MSNIGERSTVDKGRSSLGGLYQIRTQGIEQQGDNTSAYAHVFHSERFVVLGNAEQNIVYATAKVVQTCRMKDLDYVSSDLMQILKLKSSMMLKVLL